MKTLLGTLIIASFALPVAASAQESVRYPRYDQDDVDEMMDGEVIVSMRRDGNNSRGTALGLIHAPADELWAIIRDFAHQDDWYPDLTDTRLNGNVGHGVTNMPWPMSNRAWDVELDDEERTVSGHACYVTEFDYVEGSGDIDDTFGYWLLCPWADDPSYTLARYVLNVDLGVRVPDAIIRWSTRRMLPGVIDGLREEHGDRY